MSETEQSAGEIPETVQRRLQKLSEEDRQKFYRLLDRLKGTGNVNTAPAGTQYIHPIDILLSPKVFEEMQKLSDALNKPREATAGGRAD